jgi:carbon storage regulator
MTEKSNAQADAIGRETRFAAEPKPVLVLTRKTHQSIMIGDDIEVTVCSVGRDRVRIGVQAPPSVSVHREEVYREIRRGEPPPAHRRSMSSQRVLRTP